MNKNILILLVVGIALIALLAGCGGGVATNDMPTTGTEKELQLAQTTIAESAVEQDVLSQLNTIRSNKFIHLRLSKIAKAQAPSDVYFVIAKVDSTVTGDIGTINYNFAYSENNDASTLVEGVVTYNFEWKQESGIYHWVRTGFTVTKQPAKKLGTVKGKVINGITGLPVGGVRVYAEGKTNGKASLSVLTDDNGQYQISGIVEGDYEVQAYVEQFEVASSGTVQVQGGQTTDVADLKLLPQVDGYKVLMKGKVIDGDGNNAAGVKVELSGSTNETTLTDVGGNYTFGMVAAGSYKLLVTKRYKEGFETKQVDIAVTDAEIRAGNNKVIDTIYLSNKAPVVDLVQPAGGSISVNPGDVVTMKLNVSDTDSPLTSMKYDWQFPVNAVVPVDMSQGNVIEWPTPNVPGTYEIKVVVYDEKGGVAEKKISVTVKDPNVAPVINLTATASGLTATLSGSVTDSDGMVSSVGINWGDSATSSVTSGFSSISVNHTYLAAGTYTITVTATDNSGGSSSKEIVVTVPQGVTVPAGIVAWWPFNGNTNDVIGGNNGVLEGTGGQFVSGMVGQGFKGNIQSIVKVNDSDAFALSKFTFEGWIRMDSINTSFMPIIYKGDSTGNDLLCAYALGVLGAQGNWNFNKSYLTVTGTAASGKLQLGVTDGVKCQILLANSVLPLGTFTHVAVTGDGAKMRIFINGRLDNETTQIVSPFVNTRPIQLGGFSGNTSYRFNGVIDELSIYNRALTVDEVKAIYDAGSNGKQKVI